MPAGATVCALQYATVIPRWRLLCVHTYQHDKHAQASGATDRGSPSQLLIYPVHRVHDVGLGLSCQTILSCASLTHTHTHDCVKLSATLRQHPAQVPHTYTYTHGCLQLSATLRQHHFAVDWTETHCVLLALAPTCFQGGRGDLVCCAESTETVICTCPCQRADIAWSRIASRAHSSAMHADSCPALGQTEWYSLVKVIVPYTKKVTAVVLVEFDAGLHKGGCSH